MADNRFNRRDAFKIAGIGAGAGLLSGALGAPGAAKAGMMPGLQLVRSIERTQKMSADILDYHTMTDEVAEIAREAGVKKLVLTHLVPSPMNHAMEAMFVKGMRKICQGPIKAGRDLMEIKA